MNSVLTKPLHFAAAGKVVVGKELITGWPADVVTERLTAIRDTKADIAPLNDMVVKFDEDGDRGSYCESSTLRQFARIKLGTFVTDVVKKSHENFKTFTQTVVKQAKLLFETVGEGEAAKKELEIE